MSKVKLMIELSQEEYEFLKDLEMVSVGRGGYKTIQQNVINAIKFGTPITEGNAISRSALKEDFKHRLKKAKNWKENALNNGDDELVIRADAHIDFICEVIMTIDNAPTVPQVVVFAENADEKAIEDMKAELQNVIDSERPQGEWLFKHNSSDIWCSVCDENFDEIPQAFNFCPNCGAKMKGGAE